MRKIIFNLNNSDFYKNGEKVLRIEKEGITLIVEHTKNGIYIQNACAKWPIDSNVKKTHLGYNNSINNPTKKQEFYYLSKEEGFENALSIMKAEWIVIVHYQGYKEIFGRIKDHQETEYGDVSFPINIPKGITYKTKDKVYKY